MHDASPRLRPTQGAKTLICTVTHESLEAESNSIGIRPCPRGRFGIVQQGVVDVERLLHPYDYVYAYGSM
jgi:hypothetical protein